jgi:hypothetical protein
MWSDLVVSESERSALIEAMRFVLGGDAQDAREKAILEVASEMLGGPLEDARGLPAAAIAAALPMGPLRERALQSAMLATLMDERVTEVENERVRVLAKALAIEEPRQNALHHLAHQHTALAWLDLARRSFARDAFEQALRDGGPGKLYRIVGPLLGLADDAALAQRFITLGELDAGTLGRTYFEFIIRNGLSFPGEHRAVPEAGLWHDLTHVLAGYETTDSEEILVVSFIAGYRKEDAFFWMFTIVLQYHLGLKVSPYSPAKRGLFDVRAAAAAYERGTHVASDLEHWDPWPHFARPLEDVRRELGVVPRSAT